MQDATWYRIHTGCGVKDWVLHEWWDPYVVMLTEAGWKQAVGWRGIEGDVCENLRSDCGSGGTEQDSPSKPKHPEHCSPEQEWPKWSLPKREWSKLPSLELEWSKQCLAKRWAANVEIPKTWSNVADWNAHARTRVHHDRASFCEQSI